MERLLALNRSFEVSYEVDDSYLGEEYRRWQIVLWSEGPLPLITGMGHGDTLDEAVDAALAWKEK